MAAQRTRAELLVENMANAETTRTPDGGPYRRKDAVFQTSDVGSSFADMFQCGDRRPSRAVSKWRKSLWTRREPEKRYMPGHPDADKDGYVAFPKINPAEDMVDLMGATRNYEGNVAAISAVKDMIQRSIDLLR